MTAPQTTPLTTPDGTLRVEFASVEMRMSHTVNNPRVLHVPTGRIVFDRFDTLWDGSPSIDDRGRLRLDLREYPGDRPGYALVFDGHAGVCQRIEAGETGEPVSIESMIEGKPSAATVSKPAEMPTSGTARRSTPGLVGAIEGAADEAGSSSDDQSAVVLVQPPPDMIGTDTPRPDSSIFLTAEAFREPRRRRRPPRVPRAVTRALAMIVCSVLAIVAMFGLAWILAARSPLRQLPSWAGWGIAVFVSSLALLAVTSIIGALAGTGRGQD